MVKKENIPAVRMVEITGKDGTRVTVKTHIPYEEKEAMAMELLLYTNATDNETFVMFDSYKRVLLEAVLIAKYYTDIDLTDFGEDEGWCILMDWLVMNEVYGQLMEVTAEDRQMVTEINRLMTEATRASYASEHNLGVKVQKLLGEGVLESEDMFTSMAKSEEVNNVMLQLVGAYREQQKAEKNRKKMDIGDGVVVNFAKKNK